MVLLRSAQAEQRVLSLYPILFIQDQVLKKCGENYGFFQVFSALELRERFCLPRQSVWQVSLTLYKELSLKRPSNV